MDDPHVLEQVTQFTDMVLVDDCDRYMDLGQFYDSITSDLTVNPKNNHVFTIPFDESPKFAFTTNYVPCNFDPSSQARALYMVFSDWYHERTEENDYLETRSIRDDFHKTLYEHDYTEEEWNNDINFWLQCTRFYLSIADSGYKPQPPMENIIQRKYKADMGANFEDWADGYFSPEGDNLDRMLEQRTQRLHALRQRQPHHHAELQQEAQGILRHALLDRQSESKGTAERVGPHPVACDRAGRHQQD